LDAWLKLIPSRPSEIPVERLRSASLEVDVLPGMGGRIWRMRRAGDPRDLLLVNGSEKGWNPADGGYEEYSEGGNSGAVLKFPGRVSWSNLVFKKGFGSSSALWDWSYGFAIGKGKRRDGLVVLLNEMHVPNNIWYFRRGLPLKWSGPPLNATQNNVAIESVEISHEGLYQVPFVGAAAGLAGLAAGAVGGALQAGAGAISAAGNL
jgi:phage tail-like protein